MAILDRLTNIARWKGRPALVNRSIPSNCHRINHGKPVRSHEGTARSSDCKCSIIVLRTNSQLILLRNGLLNPVAGIIAATGNNARGGAGTAWTLALRPCKFLDGSGRGMISDAIVCMEWALSLGAKISCNSWGGGTRSQVFSDILDAARDRGHLFVAAAGNVASPSEVAESCPFYPAA